MLLKYHYCPCNSHWLKEQVYLTHEWCISVVLKIILQINCKHLTLDLKTFPLHNWFTLLFSTVICCFFSWCIFFNFIWRISSVFQGAIRSQIWIAQQKTLTIGTFIRDIETYIQINPHWGWRNLTNIQNSSYTCILKSIL